MSLDQPPIGETKSFIWLATPLGIAAICKSNMTNVKKPPFEDAVKEGLEVAVDLSREEREQHETKEGLILLFYS